MAVEKREAIQALDALLRIGDFHDVSNNGLQVDSGRAAFSKVCSGVDASLPFLEKAAQAGADLVICHHGLSWGDSLKRITGLNYALVKFLLDHQMALWACHLPLDAHAALGNNARLCDALGIGNRRPFGLYHGQFIGFCGDLPAPLAREDFAALLRASVSPSIRALPFGKGRIQAVGVVSGGAAGCAQEAIDAGLDAYVTGETDLARYNLCLQGGLNMFAAGHYATERLGIRAVGDWLAAKFGLAHEFVDFDIPF